MSKKIQTVKDLMDLGYYREATPLIVSPSEQIPDYQMTLIDNFEGVVSTKTLEEIRACSDEELEKLYDKIIVKRIIHPITEEQMKPKILKYRAENTI